MESAVADFLVRLSESRNRNNSTDIVAGVTLNKGVGGFGGFADVPALMVSDKAEYVSQVFGYFLITKSNACPARANKKTSGYSHL